MTTLNDKNHMGIGNCCVSSLGFVLILWDLIHGTKNGGLTLTMTDHSLTSHFTMTSFTKCDVLFHQ